MTGYRFFNAQLRVSLLPGCVAVVLMVLSQAGLVAADQADRDAQLEARQRQLETEQKVRELYQQVIDPAVSEREVIELCKELIELSDLGSQLAFNQLRPRYLRQVAGYEARFRDAARKVLLAERNPTQAERRIGELRDKVMEVYRRGNLTKAMIENESDPAVAELRRLLLIDRDEVLAAEEDLRQRREQLLSFHDLYHRAYTRMRDQARERIDTVPDRSGFESQLEQLEASIAQQATPIPAADQRTLRENQRLAEQILPEEAASIAHVNEIRMLLGLRVLRIDVRLCEASRDHSKDMAERNFFAHESPVPGKRTPWDRARNFGTTARAENIFSGNSSPQAPVRGWWYSPGHHKNMINPGMTRIGQGHHVGRWTQKLG